MIPSTINGLPAMACVSALQKCIRRGLEREAMEFAVELMHTSKPSFSMTCKRLEVISHEDIDTADRTIVPFVATCVKQAQRWYVSDVAKLGKSRIAIGNAIRAMCRAAKSREGDHFAAAIGWAAIIEGRVPELPDWAFDQHTQEGRKLGRGLQHFREVSTLLVPPAPKDDYENEAYRLWAIRAAAKRDLFE